jgi:hypothetical protein
MERRYLIRKTRNLFLAFGWSLLLMLGVVMQIFYSCHQADEIEEELAANMTKIQLLTTDFDNKLAYQYGKSNHVRSMTHEALGGKFGDSGDIAIYGAVRQVDTTATRTDAAEIKRMFKVYYSNISQTRLDSYMLLHDYEALNQNLFTGVWLSLYHYPHTDLEKYRIEIKQIPLW